MIVYLDIITRGGSPVGRQRPNFMLDNVFNLLKTKVFDGKVLNVVLESIVSEVGYLSIKCHL